MDIYGFVTIMNYIDLPFSQSKILTVEIYKNIIKIYTLNGKIYNFYNKKGKLKLSKKIYFKGKT